MLKGLDQALLIQGGRHEICCQAIEPLIELSASIHMLVSLSTHAIVDAEQAGNGRLPWAWVFVCEESAAVLAKSEPMFRSRMAALRVGNRVMLGKREHIAGRRMPYDS